MRKKIKTQAGEQEMVLSGLQEILLQGEMMAWTLDNKDFYAFLLHYGEMKGAFRVFIDRDVRKACEHLMERIREHEDEDGYCRLKVSAIVSLIKDTFKDVFREADD